MADDIPLRQMSLIPYPHQNGEIVLLVSFLFFRCNDSTHLLAGVVAMLLLFMMPTHGSFQSAMLRNKRWILRNVRTAIDPYGMSTRGIGTQQVNMSGPRRGLIPKDHLWTQTTLECWLLARGLRLPGLLDLQHLTEDSDSLHCVRGDRAT